MQIRARHSFAKGRSAFSNQARNPTFRNLEGFTLIEMLVVVCIIVLIAAMAMPSVSSYFQLSLNSASRDLATTVKQAYNSSVVSGKVHRLAFNLKDQTYWVESGPANALMDTRESLEKSERRKRTGGSNGSPPPSQFKLETSITRKKMTLPRGVQFEDLVTQESPDPIIDGTAFTHFFPYAVTEQTVIHLKDQSNHHATLVISPLLGMTDLYDRNVNAKEIFKK